jgi:hypothetical protein
MKKLALTNLMLLVAVKSVSACSYSPGYEPPQLVKFDGIYLLLAFTLIIPIVFFYYLRDRKSRWAIITSAVSLVLFIPALFFTAFIFAMCAAFVVPVQILIRAELFLMLLILTIQISLWISERKTATKLE